MDGEDYLELLIAQNKRIDILERKITALTATTGEVALGSRPPSPEEVMALRTPAGSWTKKTLASWGVPWPPPKGWRVKLKNAYNATLVGKNGYGA
jgi:hypothetical protein